MEKTKWHSYKCGKLAEGCKLCVQGKKLVLFITGKCSQRCWFCPVSEHKFGKDVVYANEWKIEDAENPKELIKEAELTDAKGAGITGGDPLMDMDRCVNYIRLLKEKYGKEFHIHLYTPLKLVNEERLQKLYDVGLDEIRFHLDIDDKLWDRLTLAKNYDWDIGVEIPVIPDKEQELKKMIESIAGKIDFLNLNELERSDTAAEHYKLDEMGYEQKDTISYGIKGSLELAKDLAEYAEQKGINVHVCTAKLKDGVQLVQRIKRRAEHVARDFDKVTEEGLLIRGCAYVKGYEPSIGFKERLKKVGLTEIEVLEKKTEELCKICPFIADLEKMRLITSIENITKFKDEIKKKGLIPAIVEEYPTKDKLEVEVEYL